MSLSYSKGHKMFEEYTNVFICLTFITLMLLFIFFRSSKNGSLNLPGPTELPMIGNFHQTDKLNLHHTFDKWADQFGEIYQCTLLGQTFLLINTSALAREIYLEEPGATSSSGRFPIFAATYIFEDSNITFSSVTETWKHRRKIAHQLLRAYGDGLKKIEGTLMKQLEKMTKGLSESQNKVLDPVPVVENFLLDNLELLITGQNECGNLRDTILELDNLINENFLHPRNSFLLTKLPWIRFLPCQLARNYQQYLSKREQLFHILDDLNSKNPDSAGIYQKLLHVLKEEEKTNQKEKITRKNVQMIVLDFVFWGLVTTRGALLSTIKVLMSRRDIQTKIQNEIDTVIGCDRNPCLSDREHCPFIEATVFELLRYISHVPLVLHQATYDFQFHGIHVPKGCLMFVNSWHIHHSEKEWADPFTFQPERFLDDDGNLVPATAEIRKRLLVFGIGKRACIGEVFAKSRIILFLAKLLQHFTITTLNDNDVPLFHPKDMKPGGVLTPTDFKCRFLKRQNKQYA